MTPDSDGINPASEPVQIELRIPGSPDPVYRNVLPAGSLESPDGGMTYHLTQTGKDATGLEKFTITRMAADYALEVIDKRATLPGYHQRVCKKLKAT